MVWITSLYLYKAKRAVMVFGGVGDLAKVLVINITILVYMLAINLKYKDMKIRFFNVENTNMKYVS